MIDAATATRLRQAFGLGRVIVGAVLAVAPRTAGRVWYGREPTRSTQMALRGLGARDLVIGVGTTMATGDAARPWLVGGAISDLADAASVVIGGSELKRMNLVGFGGAALVFASFGAWLARRP